MSELTIDIVKKQAVMREQFYLNNESVDVNDFIKDDLHSQIKFLLHELDKLQ